MTPARCSRLRPVCASSAGSRPSWSTSMALSSPVMPACRLADNRLAELAGWDEDLLAVELQELSDLTIDFNFEVTGFDTVDLDRLEAPKPAKTAKPEVVPELERDGLAI